MLLIISDDYKGVSVNIDVIYGLGAAIELTREYVEDLGFPTPDEKMYLLGTIEGTVEAYKKFRGKDDEFLMILYNIEKLDYKVREFEPIFAKGVVTSTLKDISNQALFYLIRNEIKEQEKFPLVSGEHMRKRIRYKETKKHNMSNLFRNGMITAIEKIKIPE